MTWYLNITIFSAVVQAPHSNPLSSKRWNNDFSHVWRGVVVGWLLLQIPLSPSSSSWFPSFFVIFALSSAQFFCLFAIEHPWNIFVFNLNSDKNDIIIESLTRSLSLCECVCLERTNKIDDSKCHTTKAKRWKERRRRVEFEFWKRHCKRFLLVLLSVIELTLSTWHIHR